MWAPSDRHLHRTIYFQIRWPAVAATAQNRHCVENELHKPLDLHSNGRNGNVQIVRRVWNNNNIKIVSNTHKVDEFLIFHRKDNEEKRWRWRRTCKNKRISMRWMNRPRLREQRHLHSQEPKTVAFFCARVLWRCSLLILSDLVDCDWAYSMKFTDPLGLPTMMSCRNTDNRSCSREYLRDCECFRLAWTVCDFVDLVTSHSRWLWLTRWTNRWAMRRHA